MGRKRRRSEPSGPQVIQALQMFQNLVVSLDTAGVQRLLEGREVLAAMADGRLTPKKALASLGLPVRMPRQRTILMDFFGLRKDADEAEVLAAFKRQGLRPATEEEYKRFRQQHPEVVHDLLVRSRRNLVVMAEKFRQPTRNQREICWGYPIYSVNRDGAIERYEESDNGAWDKTYRFLGVRIDARPEAAAVPSVSISHISPKVRPTA